MRGKGASQARVFRSQVLKLLSDLAGGRGAEQGFKRGLGVNRICLDEAEQEVMCRLLPGQSDGAGKHGPKPGIAFLNETSA